MLLLERVLAELKIGRFGQLHRHLILMTLLATATY